MSTKKIIITGAPGTGKSTLITELIKKNYFCFEEISRDIILEAQKQGVDQLFLEEPLLFSELLLKGRLKQFKAANTIKNEIAFFDRGIPDILAYMDYIKTEYPTPFNKACENSRYDIVFILNPWKAIFESDNERYENFNQAQEIHKHLVNTYKKFNYTPIEVPFDTPHNRVDFILNHVNR